MKEHIDKILLKKFLDGNCTTEELLKVQELLQHPEMNEILDQIMARDTASEWKQLREKSIVQDGQMKAWQARFQNLAYPQQPVAIQTISRRRFDFLKYAAIWIAVVISAGYFGIQQYKKNQVVAPIAYVTVKSQKGHITTFKLADSTTVFLNAASKLRFAETFSGKTREVYLTGEAFFDVKHDKDKPFIIHTDKVKVQVLGTSFNVKAYENDKDLSITVATGKVSVLREAKKQGQAHLLLPGDQLALNRANDMFTNSKVNPEDISAWQTGTMVFNKETLENIAHRLERWYGVSFVFENKALALARFQLKQKNENLQTIMNALSVSGNFHYKMSGTKVILW